MRSKSDSKMDITALQMYKEEAASSNNTLLIIENLKKNLQVKANENVNLQKKLLNAAEQIEELRKKYQDACEARDEVKFHVVHLENKRTVDKKQIVELQEQLKIQLEAKSYSRLSVKAQLLSYEDQIKKYEEKIKNLESIIADDANISNSTKMTTPEQRVSDRSKKNKGLLNNENQLCLLESQKEEMHALLQDERKKHKEVVEQYEDKLFILLAQKNEISSILEDKEIKYKQTQERYESKISLLELQKKEISCLLETEKEKWKENLKDYQNKILLLEHEKKETSSFLKTEKERNKKYEETEKCLRSDLKHLQEIVELERNTNLSLKKELEECKTLTRRDVLLCRECDNVSDAFFEEQIKGDANSYDSYLADNRRKLRDRRKVNEYKLQPSNGLQNMEPQDNAENKGTKKESKKNNENQLCLLESQKEEMHALLKDERKNHKEVIGVTEPKLTTEQKISKRSSRKVLEPQNIREEVSQENRSKVVVTKEKMERNPSRATSMKPKAQRRKKIKNENESLLDSINSPENHKENLCEDSGRRTGLRPRRK